MFTQNTKHLLTDYFLHGVEAASAAAIVPRHLPQGVAAGRTIMLGCGKAAAAMASVAREGLAGEVTGCVVTRYGHGVGREVSGIRVIEARHPVPDATGLAAADAIMTLAARAGPGDRVLFLISGGGSALLCAPAEGLTLAEKQAMTTHLVHSGAPIAAINLVRRHLSRVKGGRLGALAGARGAELHTLVISDVVGDDPALVASGPSIWSPFEPDHALAALRDYGWPVDARLEAVVRANRPQAEMKHSVAVIATGHTALAAVAEKATGDGWIVHRLGDGLAGEAADVGKAHAAVARGLLGRPGRHLLLSGGELTVTLGANGGRGGPNLEYLAGLALALGDEPGIAALAGDSDGIDGSEDNAGGFIAGGQADVALLREALARHDTYTAFQNLGGLVTTGPTRTNVNDIRMISVEGVV